MALNRDISILIARSLQSEVKRGLRICDPMTGSGVRGLRYAAEVEGVDRVLLNDIEPDAAALSYYNAVTNNLDGRVDVQCMDANVFLSLHSVPGKRLHLIDLDPYGSPVPFIDSAIRAMLKGGVLAMTATDMAVLCGAKPHACIRRYGGKPLRAEYSREVALRLLAGALVTSAGRQGMAAEPVFAHSTDHYIRLYARIKRSATEANRILQEMGYIHHCFHCLNRVVSRDQPKIRKCSRCGSVLTSQAGPLFLGRLTDKALCSRLIRLHDPRSSGSGRLLRLLSLELEEADAPPTYYTVDTICERVSIRTPSPVSVVEGLRACGYTSSRTHFTGGGFKTDAPVEAIIRTVMESV